MLHKTSSQDYPLDDTYYMQQALNEAHTAFEKDEVPVGAVIVCENKIIARAHNLVETLNDVTAHAEILSYTSAAAYIGAKYLTQCTMYVTLEPCVMCAGALYWSRIGRLVYGADDEKKGFTRTGIPLLHPSTEIKRNVLNTESSALLKKFFAAKR